MLAPIGFLRGGAAPFDYAANFGSKLVDWWRLDLGVTLVSGNVDELVGQFAGNLILPASGATTRPEFVATSANFGGRPSMRMQDVNRWVQCVFGAPIVDAAALLFVYYSPTFALNTGLASSPTFGGFDGGYQMYSQTNLIIRDTNAGVSLTADAATNWAGSHSAIVTFDEVVKGSVRRDGGVDRRASIQGGYCDNVNWKGFGFGTGVFGIAQEAGNEYAEVVALKAAPTFGEMDGWTTHVQEWHAIAQAPAT